MNARLSSIVGLCLGVTASAHAQIAPDPFVERDGLLLLEVESEPASGGWVRSGGIEGHTGEAYYLWDGPNNFGRSEAPNGDPIRYAFRITNPGDYELRWRSRNTVGLEGTEHNDSWVRFPTGRNVADEHPLDGWTKAYMGQVARWTWDAYTVDGRSLAIRQHFGVGDHVIDIAGRSNGHALDRIALHRYEDVPFSAAEFDGRSPSPRASREAAEAHRYAGGTCIGETLSLSGERAANRTDDRLVDALDTLRFDDAGGYAIVEFDLTDVPLAIRSASLQLASIDGALAVEAYLASDTRWSGTTATEALPYPSVLLGRTDAGGALSAIPGTTLRSVPVDGALLSRDVLSVLLVGVGTDSGAVHGVGTALEPRLSLGVSREDCAAFAERFRVDTPVSVDHDPVIDTAEDEGTSGDGTGDGADVDRPDAGDVDTTDGGVDTTDSDAGTTDGDAVDVTPPLDAHAPDGETDRSASDERTRSGGIGGLGLWALLLLVPVMSRASGPRGAFRSRCRVRG